MNGFTEKNFPHLKKHLAAGEIALLSTDTLPGLSGDPANPQAVKKIQELKKRSENKPFLLLVGDLAAAQELTVFSPLALAIAKEFWPGPLTLVLPRKKGILPKFFPNEKTLAIRVPAHKSLLNFLNNYWLQPLISTSANLAGTEIFPPLADENVLILSEKNPKATPPSTIIGVADEKITFLRSGMIFRNKIEEVAKEFLKKNKDDNSLH